MLWTEKYRPRNQRSDWTRTLQWTHQHGSKKEIYVLVMVIGNGKTAAAIALAKSMLKEAFDDNFVEVNASDDRRLETVRTTIKRHKAELLVMFLFICFR